jgi:hypothetical protein
MQYSVCLIFYNDIAHVPIPFQGPFLQFQSYISHHIVRAVFSTPFRGPPCDTLHLHSQLFLNLGSIFSPFPLTSPLRYVYCDGHQFSLLLPACLGTTDGGTRHCGVPFCYHHHMLQDCHSNHLNHHIIPTHPISLCSWFPRSWFHGCC